MFKGAFVSAFVLSVVTYAVFAWLQPAVPPSPAEMTVVFACWFGLAVLLGWMLKRLRRKGTDHAS